MNKKTSTILSAAVTGLFLGTAMGTSGCAGPMAVHEMGIEKHACAGMNTCSGKGGCKAGDNGCAGKNSCEQKGGCATVAHHDCASKNSCRGQGGCKSGNNGCAGKNSCAGNGGCAVPVKH